MLRRVILTYRKPKPEVSVRLDDSLNEGIVYNLYFVMSSDIIYEERSIYTFWDLLGDVGGLFGSLTFLSSIYISLVEFIIGSRLNQFLTGQLYTIERKKAKQPSNLDLSEILQSIRKRKPA